jgi:hypothetical protein
MSSNRKKDAAAIERFIDGLGETFRGDPRKQKWTRRIYRFEEVKSAALVILSGEFLCREIRDQQGLADGIVECAAMDILAQTPESHQYTRFYFRPHTPMLYSSEGIRRDEDLERQAHYPVPVFFIMDSKKLLTRSDVQFSDGSLANFVPPYEPRIGHTVAFLESIPFADVYHDQSFSPEDRNRIVFRRHAEVLGPGRLGLTELRDIVCRTGPERDTLLTLLGNSAVEWESRIRVEKPGERLFFGSVTGKVTYINDIRLDGSDLLIYPEPHYGEHEFRVRVMNLDDRSEILDKTKIQNPVPNLLRARLKVAPKAVYVRIDIDGHLAFKGVVRGVTLIAPR